MGLRIPAAIERLLQEVDRAASPISEISLAAKLAGALGDGSQLDEDERRGAFAEVEALRFTRPSDGESQAWGIYWGPLFSGTSGYGQPIHAPDIGRVNDDVLTRWIERAQTARHPELRARYADLAWEIGRHRKRSSSAAVPLDIPIALAQIAIDSYVDAIEAHLFDDDFTAWQYLDRAAQLGMAINDGVRAQRVKLAIFSFYEEQARSGDNIMWWRLDDLTTERAKELRLTDQERQRIVDSLENALAKHSDSTNADFEPHHALQASDRLARHYARLKKPERAKQALRSGAGAFESAAAKAGGTLAIAWLEDLIPRYRNAGMHDDAARVERTIRERAAEARSEMKTFSVPLNVTHEQMAAWADELTNPNLELALQKIAAEFLQREEQTLKAAREAVQNAPLSAMMSSAIMGEGGFTAATIGSIDDDPIGRTIRHASAMLNVSSPWLYMALMRLKEKYALTADTFMKQLDGCQFLHASRSGILRQGVEAWFANDAAKAIHVLVPQVEAALRDLLAALGAAVMVPDKQMGGFQALGMGAVIRHATFRAQGPKDLGFHMQTLYCDPRGLNLRNHLAHGLAR